MAVNKKAPTELLGTFYFALNPGYFFPPLTLAIIKMMNAIKPTTSKMPHTIPALKIPPMTAQLPKQKTKKQANRKIIDLILFILSNLY